LLVWIPTGVYPCGSRGGNDNCTGFPLDSHWIPTGVYPCESRGGNDNCNRE